MRRLFTTDEAIAAGLTSSALRWGESTGRWRRARKGVYAEGPDEPTELDKALAEERSRQLVAGGSLAAVLYGLDGVSSTGCVRRRRSLPPERVALVHGVSVTDGLQTMIDLAAEVRDRQWEQALESALRQRLLTVSDLDRALPALGAARVPDLPEPVRQVPVGHARVDLAWPDLGLFVELDGQRHRDQPIYDSTRETAVVAATGWLCGRFTWTEVVRLPSTTARRLAALADQARRRPVSPSNLTV